MGLQLWLFEVTDPLTGRRRVTRYRLTEAEASERYGESAVKVPGSLEIREPAGSTSDWQKSPPEGV
jgi:hypothetical protein